MHVPVLLGESIESLKIGRGDIVVDATLGDGGHSLRIAEKVGESGRVVAIDVDKRAIENFSKKLKSEFPSLRKRFHLVCGNFADLEIHLEKLGIGKVDGVLADLGWRIEQVRDRKYGMSFSQDAKLDMRLGLEKTKESAFEIVNGWQEERLEKIFVEYGQESNARKIAREICKRRKKSPISTTGELASIIERVSLIGTGKAGAKRKKIHPATKIFQALRIAVNGELENLEKFLTVSLQLLKPKGRIAVISFHSLEDRIVKRFFQANARGCVCPKEFPICICGKKQSARMVTRKAIVAGAEEIRQNPRSRSARLRVAEKVKNEK